MKIREIVKQILKEEFDDLNWIGDYNVTPPSDASKNPEFLMKLFQTKLKGKKSFNGYDYSVDKEDNEGSTYYISEIYPDKTYSYFFYETAENFNLENLLSQFLSTFGSKTTSERVKNEYKKLFDDLGDVFEK